MTKTSTTSQHQPGPSTWATSAAEIHWHLAEAAAILRQEPRPLSPDLLRITLRGLGELCGTLVERGQEAPVQPPYLFRDTPVVAEALGMWEQRLRAAMTRQRTGA